MVKWTNQTWRLERKWMKLWRQKIEWNQLNWRCTWNQPQENAISMGKPNVKSQEEQTENKVGNWSGSLRKKRPKLRRNKNKTAAGWENPQLSFRPKQKLKERSAFYIFFSLISRTVRMRDIPGKQTATKVLERTFLSLDEFVSLDVRIDKTCKLRMNCVTCSSKLTSLVMFSF